MKQKVLRRAKLKNGQAKQLDKSVSANDKRALSSAVIARMESLAMVLKPVYARMRQEGWVMKNGKLINKDAKSN